MLSLSFFWLLKVEPKQHPISLSKLGSFSNSSWIISNDLLSLYSYKNWIYSLVMEIFPFIWWVGFTIQQFKVKYLDEYICPSKVGKLIWFLFFESELIWLLKRFSLLFFFTSFFSTENLRSL